MGSTLSVPSQLKSYFTGDGEDAAEWKETEAAHVVKVAVPWLREDDSVKVELVECKATVAAADVVVKMKISGAIRRLGKKFSKSVKMPENTRLFFYQANVCVYEGYVVVTIPKPEDV